MNGVEFKLNRGKAINSLLYICHAQGGSSDMYALLKTLFFAESAHLFTYGRPITGDVMKAMKWGPVPSFCYDEVKFDKKYFNMDENVVEAIQKPDLDLFSISDIECLDQSIKENIGLSFPQLRDKSHTPAYEKTKKEHGLDSRMSFIDIAKEDGKANEDMIKYITSRFAV